MPKRTRSAKEQRRPILNLELLESRELLSVSVTPSHVSIPPLGGEHAVKVEVFSDTNFDASTIDLTNLKLTATPAGRQIKLKGTPHLRDDSGSHESENEGDGSDEESHDNTGDSGERDEHSQNSSPASRSSTSSAPRSSATQSVTSGPSIRSTASNVVPNHFIVAVRDSAGPAGQAAEQLGRQYGLNVDALYDAALHGFAATVPPGALRGLAADPRVSFIEQDRPVSNRVFSTGLDRVNGQAAGSVIATDPTTGIAPGLSNINVAVIDTGIDLKNPDLNVLGGVSFVSGNTTGQDDQGHGTGVASLVGAKADRAGVAASDQGITGVAPGVGLYGVKVLDRNGSGSIASIISGIDWVARNASADHILFANMSLGGTGYSQAMHDAIARATAQGVTFLVAAGNESQNAANTNPAGFNDTVITVSAMADSDGQPGGLGAATQYGADDSLASFSNYGSVVDVAAPGVNIPMDKLGGGTWVASGTSMATPIATGSAVLLVAADRRLGLTSGFDAMTLTNRWQYIRSRLMATGTSPDNTVLTDSGQQVRNGGAASVDFVPYVSYVPLLIGRHIYYFRQVSYYAVSNQGQWNNDPDGTPEPLVNAANAYALG